MGAAAALVVAQVAFVVAPLAVPGPPELLAVLGVLLVCAVIAGAAVPLVDVPVLLVPGVAGAALLAAALEAAGLDAAATPVEALAWGLSGVAFAAILDTPLLAVALPVFVAVVDLATAGGAAEVLPAAAPGDALVLTLPDGSGRLGATEALFLGAFAAYARRFRLREASTLGGMAAGLLLAVVAGPLPALALLAAGAALPNVDRVPALLGRARAQ